MSAVLDYQKRLGHHWHKGQSKKDNCGVIRKLTLRCNCYYHTEPRHCVDIDPADHQVGKSGRTNCPAHVNLNTLPGTSMWHVTVADWDHNHAHQIPVGGIAPSRPTTAHRNMIENLPDTLNRSQVQAILRECVPEHVLEPQQVFFGTNSIHLGGPKKMFLQLFDALNEHTSDQTVNNNIKVREVCDCFGSHGLS